MICTISTTEWRYRDDDPRVTRYRAAGLDFESQSGSRVAPKPCTKEFTTVAELCDWVKAIGESIILSADGSIEIYDDYRE